ncbi:MAG: hypothetical protein R2762_11005 [Bryobacteraceae bacterium]
MPLRMYFLAIDTTSRRFASTSAFWRWPRRVLFGFPYGFHAPAQLFERGSGFAFALPNRRAQRASLGTRPGPAQLGSS